MQDLIGYVDKSLAAFSKVTTLAGTAVARDLIEIEILEKPHKPPSALPYGKMAVYSFFFRDQALKVGKVGPNSHARYSYQHYNASSAASTLAGSLLRNLGAVGLSKADSANLGQWIRDHTDRVNLLLPEELGDPILGLLEAFLHVRWNPLFEGKR